jgi:S-formylglutathione hydrolase FrmB
MILTQVNFRSESLELRCEMNVLLPQRSLEEAKKKQKGKYPTLYLLHGHSDDHTAWLRWTSIERYLEAYNLAVVMPAVHNSFYTDMLYGDDYFTFISEEVPAVARDVFPLSPERADNFVAGLSMGGYGAFKLALSLPGRYAAAASLSGALDIRREFEDDDPGWVETMWDVFGDPARFPGSRNDLFALADKVARSRLKPRLFQCCGTEDSLYDENVRFRDFVGPLGFDYTYMEGQGEHNWGYWDAMIQKVLAWLPLR